MNRNITFILVLICDAVAIYLLHSKLTPIGITVGITCGLCYALGCITKRK